MSDQRHLRTELGQLEQRGHGHLQLVADTAHLHQDVRWLLLNQDAANSSNHLVSPRQRNRRRRTDVAPAICTMLWLVWA